MDDQLLGLSLSAAKDKLTNGDIKASELVGAHIKQTEKLRPLNLYITETSDQAMAAAKLAEQHYADGTARPLEGLPIGLKDLFCTKGVETTAASKILKGFVPEYESTVSQNLQDAGAISLGKVNLDEFAMGSTNETSHFGTAINPWRAKDAADQALTPGGSSGGSAALVAAHGALASTGTDTGGSIRQPAAFCGIVGLKPTYGRCSRWGIVAFASSLDQAGPMTRQVKDAAMMLQEMAGHDVKDTTSANIAKPDFIAACGKSIKGMKIGLPKAFRDYEMNDEIRQFWLQGADQLRDQGAELVDVELTMLDAALPAYYIIAPAEASSNLARYDGMRYGFRAENTTSLEQLYSKTRGEGFGKEVKRRIMMGTYVLSAGYYDAYYRQAQKVRQLIADDYKNAFTKCDVIFAPTTPSAAFPLNDAQKDPIALYLNDIFTVPVNLAGLPAINIPIGLNQQGLPIGMQFIGRNFDEVSLLQVSSALEKSVQFKGLSLTQIGA